MNVKNEDDNFSISEVAQERNLLAAILARALSDVGFKKVDDEHNVPTSLHDSRDAMKWIYSPSEKPLSFIWVCENLDLSPKTLREILHEHSRGTDLGLPFPDSIGDGFSFTATEQMEIFDILPKSKNASLFN